MLAKDIKRFFQKVKKRPNGCWEYTAAKDGDGYGIFWLDGKNQKAHRVSFQIAGGVILPGQQVLHNCDWTSCVNPKCLYAGSHQDNMDDLRERGLAKGIPKSEEWKRKARAVPRWKRVYAVKIRWKKFKDAKRIRLSQV